MPKNIPDNESAVAESQLIRLYRATTEIAHPTPEDKAAEYDLMCAIGREFDLKPKAGTPAPTSQQRALLIRCYEASCAIEHPDQTQSHFRSSLFARIKTR